MNCRRCDAPMKPGIAMGQTYTSHGHAGALPHIVTVSAGGPGVVIACLKCPDCGWSVTA